MASETAMAEAGPGQAETAMAEARPGQAETAMAEERLEAETGIDGGDGDGRVLTPKMPKGQ